MSYSLFPDSFMEFTRGIKLGLKLSKTTGAATDFLRCPRTEGSMLDSFPIATLKRGPFHNTPLYVS